MDCQITIAALSFTSKKTLILENQFNYEFNVKEFEFNGPQTAFK